MLAKLTTAFSRRLGAIALAICAAGFASCARGPMAAQGSGTRVEASQGETRSIGKSAPLPAATGTLSKVSEPQRGPASTKHASAKTLPAKTKVAVTTADSAAAPDTAKRGPEPVGMGDGWLGVVKLYYATDRVWTGSGKPPKWFGHVWNDREDPLTYGTCHVTIPVNMHQTGLVEKPSIWSLEFSEDPHRHVVAHKPRRLERDPFFKALAEAVSAREQKDIVIFIHGFNNTFDDAVSRLGVLAYDMQFNGIPVLYSWCSRGGTWGVRAYPSDEERVAKTIRPLAGFLGRVAEVGREAGARRINVVAHSMGNRALVGAFQILAAQKKDTMLFDEAVMAAPDVPATGFANVEWPHMQGPAKRVTLYASADDKALIASKNVHEFRRLGEGGEGVLLLPGLDTIDASGCDFSLLGLNHTYFGGKKVLSDLRELIEQGLSPLERKLREKKFGALSSWLLPDAAP